MNEASQFRELLGRNLGGICQLSEVQFQHLYSHYQYLTRWNQVLNLTAVHNMEFAVTRHYSESIFAGLHLPSGRLSVADIGSGAGFPGVPMAIVRPDCLVTLVESHQRKAVFLKEVTRSLSNATVAPMRAEDLEQAFDWLVSRAVQPDSILDLVPKLARNVALLVGRRDATRLGSQNRYAWDLPVPLPWAQRTVLMSGHHVPRET